MKSYDLVIIGSGPGGYVAALYASRQNLSVSVVESDLVGGTCLNRGCIPTKAMLNSATLLSRIKESSQYGIDVSGYNINFQKIISRKDEVVSRLRTGIETLFKAGHVDLIKGRARLTSPDTIGIGGADSVKAKSIIIATGSKVMGLPNIKCDEINILSSDGILASKELPKTILVIGGGVIGCEFATLFNALGTKVVLVELLDRLLPTQSKEASKKLEIIFKKRGIDVYLATKAESISKNKALRVKLSNSKDIDVEKVLVAVGRSPDTLDLGLEGLGVKTEGGRIVIDGACRTSISGIYAVGDCVGGPLLAHKASYEGILACDNILGKPRSIDYSNVPNCIYTDPEIASVGLNEEAARQNYADVRIGKFPYLASGKAYLLGKTEGYIKIVGDSKGTILGIEIFGEGSCDLIGEATLAKTVGVNIKDLSHIVHGHPTLSEIFQEAAQAFLGTKDT
ncbi:MAG: dihydrolipoyl dehydrogenase [Candidatus Omnitrophica bacterium]|nr:dihydrolipoyl dehydrogenase [Candidatus Omnitrophota bacterium]